MSVVECPCVREPRAVTDAVRLVNRGGRRALRLPRRPGGLGADPDCPDGPVAEQARRRPTRRPAVDAAAAGGDSLGAGQLARPTSGWRPPRSPPPRPPRRSTAPATKRSRPEASRLAQAGRRRRGRRLERQRAAYADAVAAAYQMSPQLTALGAISGADGITDVVEGTAALQNAEAALQGRYDAYRVVDTWPGAADAQAADARRRAQRRRTRREARATPPATPRPRPPRRPHLIAGERDAVIGELARLQGISVGSPSSARTSSRPRPPRAAAAAEQQAEEAAQQDRTSRQPARPPSPTAASTPISARAELGPTADRVAHAQPVAPTTPTATPTPTPTPTTPPAPPPAARRERRRRGRDRLRPGPARRAVQVRCRRPELVGLLRPDDEAWAGRREVAAALLGRAVPAVDADLARPAPARRPAVLGRRRARRRSTTSRSTSAAG